MIILLLFCIIIYSTKLQFAVHTMHIAQVNPPYYYQSKLYHPV